MQDRWGRIYKQMLIVPLYIQPITISSDLRIPFPLQYFPYTVPYLYPMVNTFMTGSGYMTAAVAVNRYLDISGGVAPGSKRLSGYVQAFIVLLASACINIPRWMELECSVQTRLLNVTNEEGQNVTINKTVAFPKPTHLRELDSYIRDYTLISATVLIVIVPTSMMLVR